MIKMIRETNKEYIAIDFMNDLFDIFTEKGLSELRYWEEKDDVVVYDLVLETY